MTAPREIPEAPDMDAEFASDLGWRPGYWPTQFDYDGRVLQMLRFERDDDGDVKWADYGYDGGRLRVFND